MSCYLCAGEGLPQIQHRGQCAICGGLACADPSGRADRWFHGEFCTCQSANAPGFGCDEFICERHLLRHAMQQHGSRPPQCFPSLTQVLSAAAGSAAQLLMQRGGMLRDLGAPPAPAALAVLERFVAGVGPGPEAVAKALAPQPLGEWRDLTYGVPTRGETLEEAVVATFIGRRATNRAFLSRIAELAAREQRVARSRLKSLARPAGEGRDIGSLTLGKKESAYSLGKRLRRLGEEVPAPSLQARRSGRAGAIPTDPEALARWLLAEEGDELAVGGAFTADR